MSAHTINNVVCYTTRDYSHKTEPLGFNLAFPPSKVFLLMQVYCRGVMENTFPNIASTKVDRYLQHSCLKAVRLFFKNRFLGRHPYYNSNFDLYIRNNILISNSIKTDEKIHISNQWFERCLRKQDVGRKVTFLLKLQTASFKVQN